MPNIPLIKFKNIEKSFGKNKVLYNLNLDIYSNQITILAGKSGCGKSTLLKILLGFYKPDSGMILYDGNNLVYHLEEIRKITGFVSQENSFYEKLTVYENLNFFGNLYGVNKRTLFERINKLLSLINLENSKNIIAEKLSGGMKRRLEFAISLIHNPSILILDEPFTGLDIRIRDELWDILEEIKQSGVTILIATHLLNSATKHTDRIIFINEKKIIYDSKLEISNIIDLEVLFKEVIKK